MPEEEDVQFAWFLKIMKTVFLAENRRVHLLETGQMRIIGKYKPLVLDTQVNASDIFYYTDYDIIYKQNGFSENGRESFVVTPVRNDNRP